MSALSSLNVLSRRRVLKLSLSAGGLLAMGGAGGLWALRGRAPEVAGLRQLTAHEHRTFAALAEAAFPAGAGRVDLARAFDTFLADEPPWNVEDLKRALFLLEFGPVIFERRLATFSRLPVAERLAHFERWAVSDSLVRRQVAVAFRKFMCLIFYDTPEVWPHIGYDGPPIPVEGTP